mmetsp:Transcript_20014/g.59464  ORF Transcript_20014/g.59464 Transcript_20014/m.59464 type:complete len:278 (+) Transcript_20014:370-1203(+)
MTRWTKSCKASHTPTSTTQAMTDTTSSATGSTGSTQGSTARTARRHTSLAAATAAASRVLILRLATTPTHDTSGCRTTGRTRTSSRAGTRWSRSTCLWTRMCSQRPQLQTLMAMATRSSLSLSATSLTANITTTPITPRTSATSTLGSMLRLVSWSWTCAQSRSSGSSTWTCQPTRLHSRRTRMRHPRSWTWTATARWTLLLGRRWASCTCWTTWESRGQDGQFRWARSRASRWWWTLTMTVRLRSSSVTRVATSQRSAHREWRCGHATCTVSCPRA